MKNPVWIPVWLGIIGVIPGVIGAVASALNLRHLAKIKTQVDQIKTQTDGLTTKLLQGKDELRVSTNAVSFEKGKEVGKIEAKKEGEV